ncbi:hypothetical protein ACHAXT_001680 [Thalassiosira profunda]
MPRDRDDPEREQRRRERKERKRRERREREAREQQSQQSNTSRGAPVDLDEDADVAAVDVDESNGGFNGADGTTQGGGASLYADEPSTLSSHQDRELSELQLLCDAASESDPSSWEKIRRWLRNHSADDARAAAERRGDYETTPLHLACRNGPPLDIVNMLLTASPRTVELADSFGWLPLHYACANEASEEVLVMLAEQYPESKTSVDKRRRTPLHFALGHTERPANVATVVLLSGTGAALMADENGMLPLHYACAYGATEQALRVLTDENIQTITATDNRGRTPLHFALGNADRPASPGVVGLLLSQNPAVVNSVDLEGNLPIHLLATRAQAIKEYETEKCTNCQECFSLYLNAGPAATADLLTALQSLPDWLRDSAVLSPVVQKILNMKIAQRFPTAIVLMDFVFYVLVIAFFQLSVIKSLEDRYNPDQPKMSQGYTVPLYLAVFYFSVREIVQALSLASLGLFNNWVTDLENWLDVVYILLIFFWTICISVEGLDINAFQIGTAISMGLFWVMVLNFLQSIIVGFAVFVGGLMYVVKRLIQFLVALAVILIMFTQMFYTLYRMDEETCPYGDDAEAYTEFPEVTTQCGLDDLTDPDVVCTQEVDCEPINTSPFCNFRTSFFKVFTMLLGEVDETYFYGNKLATFIFAMFMFSCVIVLANVLIAIVTDSYSVIQNERAALVFWSNRLDFVAEIDVVSNNFSRKGAGPERGFDEEDNMMGELWKKLMYLYDDDVDEHGVMSIEFIVYNILRFFVAVIVIPLWMILGFVTFGMLWPPQVRKRLLTSQMTTRSKEASKERIRLEQLSNLKEDVTSFEDEVRDDMERGRDELYIIKTVLDSTKTSVSTEMNEVKEIVTELFELLSQR